MFFRGFVVNTIEMSDKEHIKFDQGLPIALSKPSSLMTYGRTIFTLKQATIRNKIEGAGNATCRAHKTRASGSLDERQGVLTKK